MMNDPIGDMIIRLKNAGEAGLETVSIPYSKLKMSICELLEKEGYIKSCAKKGKKVAKTIEVELIYEDGEPRIQGVRRVSKLSRRIYQGFREIRPVRHGYGMRVLTTPQGILSDNTAKKEKVGGEALFEIW